LPETVIDMSGGVNAEAINFIGADPGFKNINKSLYHTRMFRKDIIQTMEVTIKGILTFKSGLATIVIQRHIV